MNKFYEEARQKLRKESSAGKFDRYGSAMKTAVVKALEDFCRQSEVFAEAVAHGRSFEECMKAVSKGISGSISDLEAYQRAVKYYMKDADVRFCMEITVGGAATDRKAVEPAEQPVERKAPEIIDLSAFM